MPGGEKGVIVTVCFYYYVPELGQVLLKVLKYKYKYFEKYLSPSTSIFDIFKMYLSPSTSNLKSTCKYKYKYFSINRIHVMKMIY